MFEFSWLLFYLLLHLALAVVTVPWLYWLSLRQRQPAPHIMLRLWTTLAFVLFILPALLLTSVADKPAEVPLFSTNLTALQLEPTEKATLPLVVDVELDSAPEITKRWALTPQLLYLLSPPLWLVWLLPLGMLIQGYRFYQSYRLSQRLWHQAEAVELPDISAAYPAVYQHNKLSSAMLLGLRQPRILIPAHWLSSLSAEQLQHVIAHEQMHWQRSDLPAFYLQQLAGIICFWSPCWKLLCRQLNSYRELSCDAAVTVGMSQPYRYAQTLLDCSKKQTDFAAAALAMPWQQQPLLARRIGNVLQGSSSNITPSGVAAVVTVLLAVLMIFTLAHKWQLAQLPQQYSQVKFSQLGQLDELIQTIKQHDLPKVQQLLAQGYPVNQPMPGEGTALMVAVRTENLALVDALLEAGADINASSRGDGNALIIAVQRRNLLLAQRLVAAGADVNAVVLADETPLINASYLGDLQMVQYLLSAGASVNLKVEATLMDGRELRSALSRASTDEVRAYLKQHGASL